jgi:hypothetical protein
MTPSDLDEAATLLRDAGYLVVKIPPCGKQGRDHGRHILITRSASCPGGGTIPHGAHGGHLGTFGYWVNCRCGDSFSDYSGPPSDWEKHKQAHPEWFELKGEQT